MASLKDVAQKAGVSTATVSRVVNEDCKVKELTKEKVLKAMKELNYRPNAAARRLAGGKSHVIGFMISEYIGPIFSRFLNDVESNLRLFGRHMVVTSGRANLKMERESINFLKNSDVDGLILYTEVLANDELEEISGQIPTAILNRHIPAIPRNCVWQDNSTGMKQILTHLEAQNFKNIGLIAGPQHKPDGYLRKKAVLQIARQLNMNIQIIAESDFTIPSGYKAMQYILAQKKKPDVVICANDETALGALKAMNEHGLSCPQDIALTGYDNIPSLEAASPHMTTVELPVSLMSREITKLIMNLTYGHDYEIQNRFAPKLMTCRSSMNLKD